jgi:outer membrane protein OmpU
MRKLLLFGASGLALGIGVSSNAALADDPIKVSISGTGQEWFGYATNSRGDVGAYSKTFAQSNNDFALNGSTKLDNGITVSVSLSMNASPGGEGSNACDVTKAPYGTTGEHLNTVSYDCDPTGSPETNYVGFAGSFGSVNIGWQGNAAVSAITDAPYLGVAGLSWSRWTGWIVGPATNNLISGSGETATYDDYWANKVVYSTPSWNGLQASASFTPAMNSADGNTFPTSGSTVGTWAGNSESAAITYAGDMASAKIKAALAWTGESFNGVPTPGSGLPAGQGGHVNGYSGSLNVTFGGFTVGGAVNDREVGGATGSSLDSYDLRTALSQGITWDVGVEYQTGPWAVAVNYFTSGADDNNANGNTAAAGNSNVYMYGGQLQYTLGPGITLDWENGLVYYKVSDDTTGDNNKNHGFYSLLSTTVNF